MLWVAVGVPTGALMLQHQCVIHKACSGAELKSEQCSGLSQSMPEGGPGQQKNSQEGTEQNWFLVQVYPTKWELEDLDTSRVRDPALSNTVA